MRLYVIYLYWVKEGKTEIIWMSGFYLFSLSYNSPKIILVHPKCEIILGHIGLFFIANCKVIERYLLCWIFLFCNALFTAFRCDSDKLLFLSKFYLSLLRVRKSDNYCFVAIVRRAKSDYYRESSKAKRWDL